MGGMRAPWWALTAGLLWAGFAHGQAWLPSQGSADLTFSYSDSWTTRHWLPNGDTVDAGHTRILTYSLAAEYSPTDRWMLALSLPLVQGEYHGAHPHPTYVDDGSYHETITDLRMEAHYQLLLNPLAIAPYVAYVLPTHEYETLGHAAPGRGLDELWVGVGLGKSLDRWIPRTYIEGRFTYAFVEAVHGVTHDKENVEIALGYFFTPYLNLQGYWRWQQTLGGIDVPVAPTSKYFPYHDQLAADAFTNIGASTTWTYSDHWAYSLAYLTGIAGRNGHKIDDLVSVSVTYDLSQH